MTKWNWSARATFNCRWIGVVEKVEELKKELELDSLAHINPFRESHVAIHVSRPVKRISTSIRSVIDSIEIEVAVRIFWHRCQTAEEKPALRTEDAADLDLPGQLDKPVELKHVSEREIGRPFVEIRAVQEGSSLRNKVPVCRGKGTALVALASSFFGDFGHRSYKTIRGQSNDPERVVVGLMCVGIAAAQNKAATEPLVEAGSQTVVSALEPGPEPADLACGHGRQESPFVTGYARDKGQVGLAHTEDVLHIAVIIVGLDYDILCELSLDSDAVTQRVRSRELAIDSNRLRLCRYNGVGQRAERTKEKESGRQSNGRTCLVRVLLWSQA